MLFCALEHPDIMCDYNLETFVTKRRDRKAALKFLEKAMKRCGEPEVVATHKLRSYGAAMDVIGNGDRQETGRCYR